LLARLGLLLRTGAHTERPDAMAFGPRPNLPAGPVKARRHFETYAETSPQTRWKTLRGFPPYGSHRPERGGWCGLAGQERGRL